jgi:hypothetical protein
MKPFHLLSEKLPLGTMSFEDISTGHPLIPIAREKTPRPGLNTSSLEPRRQTMTNRELSAFRRNVQHDICSSE